MIKTVIIEDEKAAQENLLGILAEIPQKIEICAILSSVKKGLDYFSSFTEADLVLSDVQLTDGLSFEIFNAVPVGMPVIFITAYDHFMMNAFEYNGIDYLLKPVDKSEVEKSIRKYEGLEKHFSSPAHNLVRLTDYMYRKSRTRVVARKGMETLLLKLSEVVLFYTDNKIVYVVDHLGRKYMTDRNLTELESELDTGTFFRANRQYIVNLNFIRGFKTADKVKLKLELTVPELSHSIIVSQETAPVFRKWMSEA